MVLRKIEAMHKEYGRLDNKKCADCCNLSSYTQNRKWYKCQAYGVSSSEATDWARSNIACGLFGVDFTAMRRTPLINKLKRTKNTIESGPIEGQISWGEK